MKFSVIFMLLFTCFIADSSLAEGKKLHVAYAIPRTVDDMFFGPTVRFMQNAADNLGVNLEIIESAGNHIQTLKQIKDVVKRLNKPDVIIALSAKENGAAIIRICQRAGVPIFIENAGVIDPAIGAPREKYPLYIGEMLPDDEMAGYLMAKHIINLGKVTKNGKIQVAALNGPFGNGPAVAREKGLRRAIKETPNAELKQIVNINWDATRAGEVYEGLSRRYPDAKVIWTASDGMALGAEKVASKMGLKSGVDYVIGGIDWSSEGVDALKANRIQATSGGQFMEAAWALVVVYDYLHNIDFAKSDGVRMKTDMALLTKDNIDKYSVLLEEKNWGKINFKMLTKKHNPTIKKYNFTLARVLEILTK